MMRHRMREWLSARSCVCAVPIVLFLLIVSGCRKSEEQYSANQRESSPKVQLVDIANDQSDPQNLSDTEPSIAVNPKDPNEIAIVAFSERWSEGAMAPVWKSRNSGASWSKIFQIPQPGVGLAGPGDQKVAFDSGGRLYVAELGVTDNDATKDFIYRQDKGRDDPLTPGPMDRGSYGDDQPHLTVDAQNTPCQGHVYSAWLDTRSNDLSMDSHSADQGKHLQDVAVGDNRQFPNRTTRISVSSDGKAYVLYKMRRQPPVDADFEQANFRVKRSDDCGKTWGALGDQQGIAINGTNPAVTLFTVSFGNPTKGQGKVARARSSDGWIAASATAGEVYAAYINRDNSGFAQIYLAHSVDSGSTWSSNRVTNGQHQSGFPEVAVNSSGVVAVLYIDYDDSGSSSIFRHRFATSTDKGKTWQDTILQSMDPDKVDNALSGFMWGDYEGLTSNGNTFYGVFSGESINRAVHQLDPIFFKVTATP